MHQNPITYAGWTGAGYIITDPQTGAGAYKISGGSDGGFLSTDDASLLGFVGFALGLLGVGFGAPLLVFISAAIAIIVTINFLLDYLAINHQCSSLGYLVASSVIAALVGVFTAGFLAVIVMYIGLLFGGGAVATANSSACRP